MLPEAIVVILLAGLAIGGAIVRRWWFALAPLVVWPVFYAGLREGWWLYGVGDGWQYAAVAVTVSSVVTTAAGVAVGRAVSAVADRSRYAR